MSLGISFKFVVHPDGGEPYEVVATSRDLSAWERIPGGGRVTGNVGDELKMSHLDEIAHLAARRQGRFSGSLNEFREQCDLDFKGQGDESGADPT